MHSTPVQILLVVIGRTSTSGEVTDRKEGSQETLVALTAPITTQMWPQKVS